MANYKIGTFVETKEHGKVLISKVSDKGEIVEVQKFEPGQKEPLYIRVEELANKTLTILNYLQAFVLFIKNLFKKP